MTIALDESIRAIWFANLSDTSDFMAGLNDVEGGDLKLTWRFRYYSPKSADVWDMEDEKSWGEAVLPSGQLTGYSQAEITSAVNQIVQALVQTASALHGGQQRQVAQLVRGKKSVRQFAEELQAQPWAHWKKVN